MADSFADARRSRRWMVTSVLAIGCGLAGAALVICIAPRSTPIAVAMPPPVVASAPVEPASGWSMLTPAEQRTLAPLKANWEQLNATAKARWIAVAERLQGKPSRAVARAAQHMDAWQHLGVTARAQARLHYVMASRLSPAERRRRWDDYQSRPHPERAQDEPAPRLTMVAPSLAQDRIGATSVLLTDVRPAALPLVHVRAEEAPASAPAAGDAS